MHGMDTYVSLCYEELWKKFQSHIYLHKVNYMYKPLFDLNSITDK
jgi:hypothetical protein